MEIWKSGDLFRDDPTYRLALGTGQTLNLICPPRVQNVAFAFLVVFCLTIPSNWTQDVPVRYARRHPGMTRTWPYPPIDAAFRR